MGPATKALEGQFWFKNRWVTEMMEDEKSKNVPSAFCFDQMVWRSKEITSSLQGGEEEDDSFPAITWDLDDDRDDFVVPKRAQYSIPATLSIEISTLGNIVLNPRSRTSTNLVNNSSSGTGGMVRSIAFTFGLDSILSAWNEAERQKPETHILQDAYCTTATFQSSNDSANTGNLDLTTLCILSNLSRSKQHLDSRIYRHDSSHATQRMLV